MGGNRSSNRLGNYRIVRPFAVAAAILYFQTAFPQQGDDFLFPVKAGMVTSNPNFHVFWLLCFHVCDAQTHLFYCNPFCSGYFLL